MFYDGDETTADDHAIGTGVLDKVEVSPCGNTETHRDRDGGELSDTGDDVGELAVYGSLDGGSGSAHLWVDERRVWGDRAHIPWTRRK